MAWPVRRPALPRGVPRRSSLVRRALLAIPMALLCLIAAACQGETSTPALPPPTPAADKTLVTIGTPPLPLPTQASPSPIPTSTTAAPTATPVSSAPTSVSLASSVPVYTYQVVNAFPHDPGAFTQGLVYLDGVFYEGTGLRGQSTLRIVDPTTGQVLQGVRLPDEVFGEGIAILGDKIYQLSWQEQVGFVYDRRTLTLLDTWSYVGEGWGLTTDGQQLIMSDGTNQLRFLDPDTLQERERLAVVDEAGQLVTRLNELEYIEGEVWANVWQTDLIARIDPASGRVTGWVDLSGLLPPEDRAQPVDVLNGIAYDAATGRLFVTGKWWPKLFEIVVLPVGPANPVGTRTPP